MRTFNNYLLEQDEATKREQSEVLGTLINAVIIATKQVAEDLHAKNVAKDVWKAIRQLLVKKTIDQPTETGTRTVSARDMIKDPANVETFKLLRNLGVWMNLVGDGKIDQIVGEGKEFASDEEFSAQLAAIADKLEKRWQERGQPFMPTK